MTDDKRTIARLRAELSEARQLIVDMDSMAWETSYSGPPGFHAHVKAYLERRCNGRKVSWHKRRQPWETGRT